MKTMIIKIKNCLFVSRTDKLKIRSKGFTFVETMVVLAILIILTISFVSVFVFFRREFDLNNSADLIKDNLIMARINTLASEQNSQYGVYFDISVSPHQYIVFKGESFSLRDPSFDKVYQLPKIVEIYDIGFATDEVVFNKMTGSTDNPGDISLRLTTNNSKTKTIYVESFGQVDLTPFPIGSDDNRAKDSRHVHFDYNRLIDTATEEIVLNFANGLLFYNILISENLSNGEIYWEGDINVNDEIQKIKIHTHRLNNPGTEFCVHRDRMDNNESLTITISGDGSGSLVEYSNDGLITNFMSIYVDNFSWQ